MDRAVSPLHRVQNILLDLLLIRASIELICDGDVGMAEEIFDEGQVLRAPVEPPPSGRFGLVLQLPAYWIVGIPGSRALP